MNELTADERARRRGRMARIVPIIRPPFKRVVLVLSDPYFVRWICNNDPSWRWQFDGPRNSKPASRRTLGANY